MLQYYMTSISRASERGRALGFPLSLSLPSLRGSCCWGHAANKLLGFALHFASPQVEGSDPPESGVSTASSTRGGWESVCCWCYCRFCLLILCHPLAVSMSHGGLLRDCIGMPWLVPSERQGQVVSRASTFGKPESERELLLLIVR